MAAMLALRRPGGVRKLSRSVIGLLLARILPLGLKAGRI